MKSQSWHNCHSTIFHPSRLLRLLFLALLLLSAALMASSIPISKTLRGTIIETNRYRVVVSNGVITAFRNKLTGEEYLKTNVQMEKILPHLPSGLGTQAAVSERDAARTLFQWPWWEHPIDTVWPNHHYPDATSIFTFTLTNPQKATLTYIGLTNSIDRFDDELYALDVEIDKATGDLLMTPSVTSPRGGVYGCGVTVAPLVSSITIEAPIFEGMQVDKNMIPSMYSNAWANFWDYSFLALNGEKTGAVGVWCQDAKVQLYKSLFYLVNDQGLSFSVLALNIPPFEELKSAKPIAWHLQAFDKSWSQAAARFREWRQANVKIAPRPEWVKKLSFMYYGMDKAGPGNIPVLEKYFEGKDLDRVITWAPAVRAAGFDNNHANNDPYPGFAEDMKVWKAKNLKVMVYLQPMIMWNPNPKTEREKLAVIYSNEANNILAFRPNKDTIEFQHHLGSPNWQRWFLDWVKEYIQVDGADGIYHDQTYVCTIDARGLAVNGMTTPQGMADYFYKAATENPNAIHGTEHMMEANNVGASLGLGCGIIWGTPGYLGHIGKPGSVNWQRIKHGSPVSNALHYPNGAIFGFPHQSDYASYGAQRFHDGMEQMERRGDLPAIAIGVYDSIIRTVPFEQWANEVWLDRQRAVLFVRNGLHASFPENWDRQVLSYFQGAHNEDFRYEQLPWGTSFVQYQGRKRIVQYGRISGVTHAAVEGGIVGWPCYDKSGPTGLNPAMTYVLDPSCKRPASWFSLSADDVSVIDGYSNESFACMQLQPLNNNANGTIAVVLSSSTAPKAIWVDGQAVKPIQLAEHAWQIQAEKGSTIVAILQEPIAGNKLIDIRTMVTRFVDPVTKRDILRPGLFPTDAVVKDNNVVLGGVTANIYQPTGQLQTYLPLKAPADHDGILRITTTKQSPTCLINGKIVAFVPTTTTDKQAEFVLEIPFKRGEDALLSLISGGSYTINWVTAANPIPGS